MNLRLLFKTTAKLDQLPQVAEDVAKEVTKVPYFCLWLQGELGAGKTTFAGQLLYALGLERKVPVLSPTYTYMTEYQIKGLKIWHLDLYRLPENTRAVSTILSDSNARGYIVEWPERALNSPEIEPSFILKINYADPTLRAFEFYQIE
jgi:tRNA threonylcarbamoyl adenosine modification protein YjeE